MNFCKKVHPAFFHLTIIYNILLSLPAMLSAAFDVTDKLSHVFSFRLPLYLALLYRQIYIPAFSNKRSIASIYPSVSITYDIPCSASSEVKNSQS